MRLDYHPLLNRVAWILVLLLLPTWGLTELMLVRWGRSRYPLNLNLNSYTAPTDVVFLGDSRVSAGINPLVLDQYLPQTAAGEPVLSSHNLGVQGTSFGIQYLILKRMIEQGKVPRVAIQGYAYNELTETFFFENPDLAEVSDVEDWPLLREKSLQTPDEFLDLVFQNISRIYRYRFHIRHVIGRRVDRYLSTVSQARSHNDPPKPLAAASAPPIDPVQERPPATDSPSPQQVQAEQARGFYRHISLTADLDVILANERSTYEDWFWEVDNWDDDPADTFLPELIALSQEHDIDLIVVKLPTTELYSQMEAESPYVADYEQRVLQYLQAHQIPHYDLSESIPDALVWDTIHLTPEGAAQFTERVYRRILRPRLAQWQE